MKLAEERERGRERLVYRICSHASASASRSESSISSLDDYVRTEIVLNQAYLMLNVKINPFVKWRSLFMEPYPTASRPKQRSGSTRREREGRKSFEWVIKYADRAPPAATLHLHSWYS